MTVYRVCTPCTDRHIGTSQTTSFRPLMLLLAVVAYDLSTGIVAFNYAGPTVWNSLPDELRNADSFDSFKRLLKTISLAATSVISALDVIL